MLGFDCWSCLLSLLVGGVLLSAVALFLLKLYKGYTLGICNITRNMNGKTVIVTGSNSGIGKETARDLARRGARVIMACRNLETANKAKDEIVKETNNENIVVCKLDLSSLESVREFAAEINKTESRLDVLIHNAGVANVFNNQVTSDGLELTMATNQFGPFLLTHLLIDLLKKTGSSRIVIVASELYKFAKVSLRNPNPVDTMPVYLYYVSKYANIMFCKELARRLEGTGVTANCLHPGMIDSGIWRNVPFPLNIPTNLIVKSLFKTTEQGAQTSIYLAVSEDVGSVSGKYFSDCKEHSLWTGVQDMGRAKRYWEICEGLVQLKSSDPRI